MLLSEQLIQSRFSHEHLDDYYGTEADIYQKFWKVGFWRGGGITIVNPDLWYRDVFLLTGNQRNCNIVIKLEHPRVGRVIDLVKFIEENTNIQLIKEEMSRDASIGFCEYPLAQPRDCSSSR